MPTSAQMTTIRRADVGIGPYKAIIGRPLAVGGVPPLAMRSHPGRNRYPMFFARYRYNTIIGRYLAVECVAEVQHQIQVLNLPKYNLSLRASAHAGVAIPKIGGDSHVAFGSSE